MVPLALDISPYEFACDGTLLGIPHFWNVVTNIPFLLIGIWGFTEVRRLRRAGRTVSFNWTGIWVSTACIGLGSGAYHLFLTPFGLGLDRLAIAGLIAFLGAHVAQVIHGIGPSRRLTFWLVLVSETTVVVWMLGGSAWFYGVLQAAAGLGVVLVVVRADLRTRRGLRRLSVPPGPLYLFAACYGLAKVCELFDAEVCSATGWIGGHPLKHVFAALGLLLLAPLMGRRRTPGRGPSPTP